MTPAVSAENSSLITGAAPPEPIAIIGIGCRFPGASGVADLWRLLRAGGDAITEIPADRFDVEALYDPRPAEPGRTRSRWAGLLSDVTGFDAAFFGIAPREAVSIDPQHRLLLEAGWEAMEDAGETPGRLACRATGVFIGETSSDYGDMVAGSDPSRIDSVYTITGSTRAISSGRLSYVLDLRGPSLTVDTACSSSLLAVHLACQSIWRGESESAFAGGVNLVLAPHATVAFSQAGMAAGDGRCKAFAAGGDGFVRSDGVGVVLLKPLERARADGNPVYAVILGTGAGNDGQSSGLLMTPGQAGQEAVLRAAYGQAAVDPRLVQYVEAHGTGTAAGDPVEMASLSAVLGAGRDAQRLCLIGSVKTNIGHAEAAAGVAGLIKAALCLRHREIPASLHAAELNPAIKWDSIPFAVSRELTPWPAAERLLAGVNSFGVSGTNVHVVLEAAPELAATAPAAAADRAPRACLLALSANSPRALAGMAAAYADFLRSAGEHGTELADACYTAGARRAHHEHRLAVTALSAADAAEKLAALSAEVSRTGRAAQAAAAGGGRKVVFVFPGQGGQWPGMGQRLMREEPVFAAAVRQCAEAIAPYADWSLTDLIAAGQRDAGWSAIDRIQPALFAIQVALARLWDSWGVAPDAVVGHSMGEVAAAHVAGALSLDDAARVICRRSALLRRLSGRGAMAVVGLPADQASEMLGDYGGKVSVAACNSPGATVVSGEAAAVAELVTGLEGREVFCRRVEVDVASHSCQVDGLRGELLAALAGLAPRPGLVPMYSTVTGAVGDGRDLDAAYWVRNLRQPVLFADAIERAAADGHDIVVEVSPHPVLAGAIGEVCRDRWPGTAIFASARHDEDERTVALESLGGLYLLGQDVSWENLYPAARCVRLPPYQWQREHYWAPFADRWKSGAGGTGVAALRRRRDGALAHPLLERAGRSASHPELHVFQTVLGPREMSYLGDHRVQDAVVFPAAGYAELALAAAEEVLGPAATQLSEVSFSRPLVLRADRQTVLRLELTGEGPDRAAFEVFSLSGPGGDDDPVPHASGMVGVGAPQAADEAGESGGPDGIRESCDEVLPGSAHYERLWRAGLSYGPSFQCVEEVWRRDGEALGRVRLPARLADEAGRYLVHPVALDACLQVLAAAFPRESADLAGAGTSVPVAVRRLRLASRPGPVLYSHARLVAGDGDPDQLVGDVTVTDESGRLVLSAQGVATAPIERTGPGGPDVGAWLYALEWEAGEPLPEPPRAAAGERWLVLCDGRGLGPALVTALEQAGAQCAAVWPARPGRPARPGSYQIDPRDGAAWNALLAEVSQAGPVSGIAHLWSLDLAEPDALTAGLLQAGQALACTSVMYLTQALASAGAQPAPRLFLVTAGAQAAGEPGPVSPAQAPLWGMGRAIRMEQPELRCALVDLSPGAGPADAGALCRELRADCAEDEVALRAAAARYVARLVPAGGPKPGAGTPAAGPAPASATADEAAMLVNPTLGVLDGLQWSRTRRRPPGPGEVEIAVCAIGLNFRDILIALGVNVGQAPGRFDPGHECSGRIAAVGAGVTGLAVGDEVMGTIYPCFGSYITTKASLVVPKPPEWSFEDAAMIPVAYGTAYYALAVQARLAAGESVLIHAAAGGVGLAAVRVAQCLGAVIFATAGSPEKRDFLRSVGVRHVLDSRSLAFADEVLALTGGRGVDVVLNSLAGAAMERSLETLASFGRFVEIGVRDLHEPGRRIGLHHFRKSQSFFAFDLKRLIDEQPADVAAALREVIGFIREHGLTPLPGSVYGPDQVTEAFRQMAQARHIGKIAIGLAGREIPVTGRADDATQFRADASYLITGGLGGLGIAVAGWMAEHGARTLVLAGRREPSGAAAEAITAMRERGVNVVVSLVDIADEAQVREMLRRTASDLPQLRGVIHAAAVLDDGIIAQLTEQRLLSVLAPKVLGAWHLHRGTTGVPLDFFVLFSSAAGLLGSPGQANYCAANTFLDALAELRRAQGQPALSIAWGAWARVGLAAQRENRGKRLAARGLPSMAPRQGLQALGQVLCQDKAQVAVVPFDYQRWCEFYPAARAARVFDRLPGRDAASGPDRPASALGQVIRSAPPGERHKLIESYLSERGARILGFAAGSLDAQRSLQRLGLDSLMAVEMRNAIEADLGVAVPVLNLLQGISVAELAQFVADQMLAGNEPAPPPLGDVDDLSDDEVDDLLGLLESGQRADPAGR